MLQTFGGTEEDICSVSLLHLWGQVPARLSPFLCNKWAMMCLPPLGVDGV